ALHLAGATGRLTTVDTSFDLRQTYTLWSGLIGGLFLMLAYFGCDQSQVQRYLTGKSVAQSRLSLLFNAVAKVPMQFLILGVGAIVFAFHTFEKPPLVFHPLEMRRIETLGPAYENVASRWDAAFEKRRAAALAMLRDESPESYRTAAAEVAAARSDALRLAESAGAEKGFSDANYIFLSFVTTHLPVGVVGLIMAAIFAAGMSTTSAEVNSLATVSVIDIYRRYIRREASDRHYLLASRASTLFWGVFAMFTAEYAGSRGTLIEAVNSLGSLFYGGMLGVFVLAFFFKRVGGTAAFAGVLCGEAAIFYAFWFTSLPFLWFNVIGCLTVVAVGLALSLLPASRAPAQ
ncbi:MAG: sodium:solute symporter family transporter, partial [Bryobacteraceae bacterium]